MQVTQASQPSCMPGSEEQRNPSPKQQDKKKVSLADLCLRSSPPPRPLFQSRTGKTVRFTPQHHHDPEAAERTSFFTARARPQADATTG